MTTYFCDGIKEVTLMNGVARLEFFRLQPAGPPGPNREVQGVTELIVALPAPSFLQALSVLEQIRDQLVKEGVVKPAGAEAPVAQTPSAPGRSPNFPQS
jgi:hypothetical protein